MFLSPVRAVLRVVLCPPCMSTRQNVFPTVKNSKIGAPCVFLTCHRKSVFHPSKLFIDRHAHGFPIEGHLS